MEIMKQEYWKLKLEHYRGSLDFPCDFCNSNSYDNLHISKGNQLKFVICKKCIDNVLDDKLQRQGLE